MSGAEAADAVLTAAGVRRIPPVDDVARSQDPTTAHVPTVLLAAKGPGNGPDLSELPIVGVLGKPSNPMLLPAAFASMLGWP